MFKKCRYPHAAWNNPAWCAAHCGACNGELRPKEKPPSPGPPPDRKNEKERQESDRDRRKREEWNFVLR